VRSPARASAVDPFGCREGAAKRDHTLMVVALWAPNVLG
jgi:hypothetical protein